MSKTTDSISSTCVLCCGAIKYFAVGPCNHHICLKCSTRMRVLCDQKYCAVCRAEMPKVVATVKLHPYNGIIFHKFPMDHKAGIAFATSNIQDEYRRLLWEACTLCSLRAPERNFKDLQDHLRREHELFYCDLCFKHLKVFSFERKAYSRKDLALHRRKGDGKDTSYRGHPLCEFCDERYFDNDELLRHLRQQHYFCHFCETDGVNNQYYNDYDNLKEHFRDQHYLCEEDHCAQEQFTHAFRSSIDLKAHRATAHSSQMSRAQARQMRQLDVEFNLPPRISDRGGGGGPGFGRERERRYHRNRGEDLSSAIQASMETNRREMTERQDARRHDRHDREERDNRRTKEKPQAKKKSTANPQAETGRDSARSKPRHEPEKKDAVAVETDKETEKRGRKEDGRASPQSEGETKTQSEDDMKHSSSRSTKSLEDRNGKQKAEASLPSQDEAVKKTGNKKNKKKSNTVSDKADNSSPKESSENTVKLENSTPCENTSVKDSQREADPPVSNVVDLNAQSAKLAWTSSEVKVEDFPILGNSSATNGNGSSAGGFNFYSALQKMDTQSKPERQPVATPAQRSFTNKNEDFPTLSSIAGILGVDPIPSRAGKSIYSQSTSAWTTAKEKSNIKPADGNPVAVKSKKKGKKSAKETQDVVASKPNPRLPPGFDVSKNGPKSQTITSQAVIPQRTPPGLPPGLGSNATTPPLAQTTSVAPPPSKASSLPVGPPPGFGVSVSMAESSIPPGFNSYVQPADFQERNRILVIKIKAYLGHQEDKFDMFRSISRCFRNGSMTALEYYNRCRMLLGDNLPDIFNELVSLLPDVFKQQELISAQNTAKIKDKDQKDDHTLQFSQTEPVKSKGKGRGFGVWKPKSNTTSSCPQCGQTIPQSELQTHLNMHQDFPSLSANSVRKRQPIAAAAPTWPPLK